MTWRPRNQRFARPAFRTLSLLVSLTAFSACGSNSAPPPALARADAQPLVALAQKIAGEGACAQQRDIRLLQQRTIGLVNAGRVPSPLQDPLISGVNGLADDTPPCVPAVPPAPTTTAATPPPPAPREHGHGHEKHGHDHKHKGKGD